MSSTRQLLGSIVLLPLELSRAETANSIAHKFQALVRWTGRHSKPPEDTLTNSIVPTGSRSTPLWSQETVTTWSRLSTPEALSELEMRWVHRTLTSRVLVEHLIRRVIHFTGAASRLKQNWLLLCRRWAHLSIFTSSKGPKICWKLNLRRPLKTWNGLMLSYGTNGVSQLLVVTNMASPGITAKMTLPAPTTPSWMTSCQYQKLSETQTSAETWAEATMTSQSCNEPWTCWSNRIRPTGLATTQEMDKLSPSMMYQRVNSTHTITHICTKPKDPSAWRRNLMFPSLWERSKRNERPRGNPSANISGARTLAMTISCKYSLKVSEKSSKAMTKELSPTSRSWDAQEPCNRSSKLPNLI